MARGGGASFRFVANRQGEDRLMRDPSGPVGQYLARMGNRMVTGAKQRANVDTGLMRSTIDFEIRVEGDGLVGILAAHTAYAIYVHDTNPFLLDAVRETIG